MRCRRNSRGNTRVNAAKIARSGQEARGLPTWRRRTDTSWRSTRISTSLPAERRTSKPSQPNNRTVIKYVSRNSTVGEHRTSLVRTKRQVTKPDVDLWHGTRFITPGRDHPHHPNSGTHRRRQDPDRSAHRCLYQHKPTLTLPWGGDI